MEILSDLVIIVQRQPKKIALGCGRLHYVRTERSDVIACDPPVIGRYVTIVIPGAENILTLCEVEVCGTSVLGKE